jgi:hypothetical protein
MSFKNFIDTEILYAADVNNHLMSQTAPRFTSTTTRDAGIPSPANGQLCVLTTNPPVTQIYNAAIGWQSLVPPYGEGGINAQGGTLVTNSTTTYANLGASFTFPKAAAATRICVDLRVSCYVTGSAGTWASFGVSVNGGGVNEVTQVYLPVLSTHVYGSGVLYLFSGVSAGTTTVQAQWKRASGSGTLNFDGGDWLTATARECN